MKVGGFDHKKASTYFASQLSVEDPSYEPTTLCSEVREALEQDPYNPDIIPLLEDYVSEQIKTKTYDFDSNIALLTLYQFFPTYYNEDVLSKIATKALMNLPSNDFFLIRAMIPAQYHESPALKHLIDHHANLECAKFKEFWAENNEMAETVPGLFDSIRSYIIAAVSITYQVVPKAVFKEALSLDDDRFKQLIQAEGWATSQDGGIRLTPNEQNQILPRKFKETIEFNEILNVMNKLT